MGGITGLVPGGRWCAGPYSIDAAMMGGITGLVPGGRWCAGPYSIDAAVIGGTAKYQEVSSVLGLIRLMPL